MTIQLFISAAEGNVCPSKEDLRALANSRVADELEILGIISTDDTEYPFDLEMLIGPSADRSCYEVLAWFDAPEPGTPAKPSTPSQPTLPSLPPQPSTQPSGKHPEKSPETAPNDNSAT